MSARRAVGTLDHMYPAERPSPSLRVSDADRQRATEALSDAYCQGRLDEVEFDHRVGLALGAQTRGELQQCLYGLPPRPVGVAPLPVPAATGSGVGAMAHFSALFTWIFGPLAIYALGQPGSVARREAAAAFNFQLIAGVACILTAVVGNILLPDAILGAAMVAGWLGWLVLTITGGARALAGQPWTNPVMRVVRWEALEGKKR